MGVSFLLSITLDTSAAEAMLARVGGTLTSDYTGVVKEAAATAGRSVNLDFLSSGRPVRWKALAPVTLLERLEKARRGFTPVAGLSTPLRWSDALRKAASATMAGVPGSDIEQDGWHWVNTLTLSYAGRQDAERPFFFYQDADVETIVNRFYGEVRNRIRRAEKG